MAISFRLLIDNYSNSRSKILEMIGRAITSTIFAIFLGLAEFISVGNKSQILAIDINKIGAIKNISLLLLIFTTSFTGSMVFAQPLHNHHHHNNNLDPSDTGQQPNSLSDVTTRSERNGNPNSNSSSNNNNNNNQNANVAGQALDGLSSTTLHRVFPSHGGDGISSKNLEGDLQKLPHATDFSSVNTGPKGSFIVKYRMTSANVDNQGNHYTALFIIFDKPNGSTADGDLHYNIKVTDGSTTVLTGQGNTNHGIDIWKIDSSSSQNSGSDPHTYNVEISNIQYNGESSSDSANISLQQ
jgi:hypothetical protein